MTVYLVEDEANIRELVLYTLRASGYEAEGFADAPAFYEALRAKLPQFILLDIMLPGEDGLSILQKLRAGAATRGIPVMMLTARDSEYDKVKGLDGGADDYLAKPFGMMELLSRMKAVLRRAGETGEADVLRAGGIALSPRRHNVQVNGEDVVLTLKEFELLALLMENPGIVLSRNVILERVWGYSYEGETRTVDVHVRSLRIKLGEAGNQIETVRGVGYRIGEAP